MIVVTIIVVSMFSFRQFSIKSAKQNSQTVAEMVRLSLTEAMINGVIDKRESYLHRLTQIEGLLNIRVIRSDHVRKQFGQGMENEEVKSTMESKVLQSGEALFELDDNGMEPVMYSIIPFIATDEGSPNCLQCHQVEVGTVLGAITIKTSIAQLKEDALTTIGIISSIVGFFAIVTIFFFRRLFKPLVETAESVQKVVKQARDGKFDAKLKAQTNDEIGQIAEDMNHLMDHLNTGLSRISNNVSQLIEFAPKANTNLLANTIGMVENLVDAAHFKQSIEEDESKAEVYQRLSRILQEEFHVRQYSIYEVTTGKNRIHPIMVDGNVEASCKWCSQQIIIRADACRAKRTGHIIDSIENPHICNAFISGEENYQHICLPIIQSGTVGSVVQIVVDKGEAKHFQELVPFLTPYLREASPVIEAKRLMDTLRESNLRDAMTGLHNRRFLEEYMETLVANNDRNKTTLSVLMLDLDYFKKVNDTYGHDAGDKVLKELAKTLTASVRNSDLVIRYGGEEFVIILQNTGDGYGDKVGEKIRAAVEQLKVQVATTIIQKTISIGVADFPTDSETFWQAIKFADVALYQAKEKGRNQVVHFSPEMWSDNEY